MWRNLNVVIVIFLLSGCALINQKQGAPIRSLTPPPSARHGYHIVQKGETLYSIAWQYGRDFKELAHSNNVTSPYLIYPGQKIQLKRKLKKKLAPSKKVGESKNKTKKPPVNVNVEWSWPAKGKVIKTFSSKRFKGIEISGRLHTPVKAAANGKVVYAGSGLRGYGNLLIIKHNETYLSAYAHNSKLLVKEGQRVNKGQPIALMGKTDAKAIKLYFEIRQNGQPKDPLKFLPTG